MLGMIGGEANGVLEAEKSQKEEAESGPKVNINGEFQDRDKQL